jgi:hypothetical protein
VLQFAVRLEDGVRVDAQRRDDALGGGQLVAGNQDAEPYRLLHLADQLLVGRQAGAPVEMEFEHARTIDS